MATTATSLNADTTSVTIGGRIHGGNQPVSSATVTLYYAGQSGLGSGDSSGNPIVAATTTSASDGTGSFSFSKNPTAGLSASGNTYSCPTSGDPLVYVVARGGNTLGTGDSSVNNSAAAFIGIYGTCNEIGAGNFINLSEATTVATMAAITQYFNPVTESVGADGITVAKNSLVHATDTISRLADVAAGTARASTPLAGSGVGVGSVNVTATPETAKLNLLANIISACVNNASASASACTTLFANATPPDVGVTSRPYHSAAFTQATDVLQALYYIFTNPGNGSSAHLQNIFNLAPAVGAPYQPALTQAPSDWTLAINYSSTSTCGSSSGDFLNSPNEINTDNSGNVWVANGQASTGNLIEISSSGVPSTCVFLGGGTQGGAVVDALGNIWSGSSGSNNLYRYNPSTQSVLTYTTPAPVVALFADASTVTPNPADSNIYFTTAGSPTTSGSLYQVANGATATTATAPVQISAVVGPNPVSIIVDKTLSVWVSSGTNVISQVVPNAASTAPNYLNGYATYQFGVPGNSYSISTNPIPNAPSVFTSTTGTSDGFAGLIGSGTNYNLSWTTTAGQAGISTPTVIAVDGRGNVWGLNSTSDTSTGLYAVSEVSVLGVSLSPDSTANGGFQLGASYLTGGNALAIDMSGNVWMAGSGNSVTELVGAGVPVYQPFSLGLWWGNRFQQIP
ncbi:MAG TPA: hypothetical protein VF214_09575 [Edaphobacter sp.]